MLNPVLYYVHLKDLPEDDSRVEDNLLDTEEENVTDQMPLRWYLLAGIRWGDQMYMNPNAMEMSRVPNQHLVSRTWNEWLDRWGFSDSEDLPHLPEDVDPDVSIEGILQTRSNDPILYIEVESPFEDESWPCPPEYEAIQEDLE
jgi:hypothetical protein